MGDAFGDSDESGEEWCDDAAFGLDDGKMKQMNSLSQEDFFKMIKTRTMTDGSVSAESGKDEDFGLSAENLEAVMKMYRRVSKVMRSREGSACSVDDVIRAMAERVRGSIQDNQEATSPQPLENIFPKDALATLRRVSAVAMKMKEEARRTSQKDVPTITITTPSARLSEFRRQSETQASI